MDWNTIWVLAQPIVAGQIRTALAGVAGSLVLSGAIESSDQASFVKIGTGIALYAIPAAWSWWMHVGQVKLLALMAKANPVATKAATTGEAVKAAIDAGSAPVAK